MPTGEVLTIDGNDYYTERERGQHTYDMTLTGTDVGRTWEYTVALMSEAELAQLILTQIAGAVTITLPTSETVTAVVTLEQSPVWVSYYMTVDIGLLEVVP